ncbi:MAG: hypothetical protein COT73_12365 [Bdellovibrio sp. CG10_big_fil_rev_8_21_14_0_10_47_8]|nr:MAG: hypothetical protein COT73_12365 [Bdellovibrio sp. CG10_big_fil_rev_8_21_14_0_10_47_8]
MLSIFAGTFVAVFAISALASEKRVTVESEQKFQDAYIKQKIESEEAVSSDPNTNRFPHAEPLFKKPEGPPQGGTIRVEHPRAAQGLQRINKDGVYQYRTGLKEKSKSGSFRLSSMTTPTIKGTNSAVTFNNMYGSSDLMGLQVTYEWQPFRSFGSLGLQLESGFATASGKGYFKTARSDGTTRAEESYNLYVVPMSAFLNYRFEYKRRQWIVPFISGGGTYFGMVEVRDDGKAPVVAGAPAVGGGGGALFCISCVDSANAFVMSQEYGIADLWLVLEARAMQGLYDDIDFTSQMISLGITVDF